MSECNKRCTASYANAGANAILWRSAVTALCHSAATTPHSSSNFTTRGALQTSANIMPGFYDAKFITSARTEAVTKKQSRSISKIKKHLWTCVLHPVLYFLKIPALRLTDGSRNTFARWLGIIKHGVTGGETRKKKILATIKNQWYKRHPCSLSWPMKNASQDHFGCRGNCGTSKAILRRSLKGVDKLCLTNLTACSSLRKKRMNTTKSSVLFCNYARFASL